MPSKLGSYQGRDVLTSGVKIRNAGDGLSKAMEVEPVEYPIDTTLHVVLECEVAKHTYEEIKDTTALTSVHDLKAGRATIVAASLVEKLLDDQERKIDEAEPQQVLELVDDEEDAEFGEPLPPEDGFGLDDIEDEDG